MDSLTWNQTFLIFIYKYIYICTYICACVITSSFFVCETCWCWCGEFTWERVTLCIHVLFKKKLTSFTVLVLKMNGNWTYVNIQIFNFKLLGFKLCRLICHTVWFSVLLVWSHTNVNRQKHTHTVRHRGDSPRWHWKHTAGQRAERQWDQQRARWWRSERRWSVRRRRPDPTCSQM